MTPPTDPTVTQIFTLIGVILSFIVGTAGLWIGIRNSQKTIFINSVTAARIEYIQNLKAKLAELCGLLYNVIEEKKTDQNNNSEISLKLDSIDQLKYSITLQLNPEDKYWDHKIIDLIEKIRKSITKDTFTSYECENDLNKLITISQYLLKLEWERAKEESQKGILSKNSKDKLYRKYVRLYENHLSQHND